MTDIEFTCPHCHKVVAVDLEPLNEERFTLTPAQEPVQPATSRQQHEEDLIRQFNDTKDPEAAERLLQQISATQQLLIYGPEDSSNAVIVDDSLLESEE